MLFKDEIDLTPTISQEGGVCSNRSKHCEEHVMEAPSNEEGIEGGTYTLMAFDYLQLQ